MTDYRKLFDLTGKTAVVLGAASGIGKSSAEALAGLGAKVVCADRDMRALRGDRGRHPRERRRGRSDVCRRGERRRGRRPSPTPSRRSFPDSTSP